MAVGHSQIVQADRAGAINGNRDGSMNGTADHAKNAAGHSPAPTLLSRLLSPVGALARRLLGNRRVRHTILALLDIGCAVTAVALALVLRMNGHLPVPMQAGFIAAVPMIALVSAVIFQRVGLYGRVWRYTSLTDMPLLLVAATLSVIGWVTTIALLGSTGWLPASVPIITWFLLFGGLAGIRVARRMASEHLRRRVFNGENGTTTAPPRATIIVGTGDNVDLALRQLAGNPAAGYEAVAILDDTGGHENLRVRGVPVLGGLDSLDAAVQRLVAGGKRPECLLLVDETDRLAGANLVRFVAQAESLGLSVARMPATARPDSKSTKALDLNFIDLAHLLGRPPRTADTGAIAQFVAGQRVMVTGAGGTIGRELVFQIAKGGPSEIVLVDASEFNLYSIDQDVGESFPDVHRIPVLCSIRQRGNVMNVFAKYRPNLVFHAAALKHVPLVETNPCAGVLTNVIGTRNVADAARRYGARAMVQVSTDKAVNPVGVMGGTKRLGELYCQALDLAGQDVPVATRFLTVRFGNVLGSSGSLIPLLQKQLSRRGPLTVTHPEIRRYFMTVHEAVLLILQGAALAMQNNTHHGRIFVLDMGEPIRILDIAERMTRLAGLEPGRDVRIEIIGLRPGEKLYEELFDAKETRLESTLPGIFEAEPAARSLAELNAAFDRIAAAAIADDSVTVRALLPKIVDPSHNAEAAWFSPNMPTQPAVIAKPARPSVADHLAAQANAKAGAEPRRAVA